MKTTARSWVPSVVVDASAGVELLLRSEAGERTAQALTRATVSVPAHFDAEVLSALGRLVRDRRVPESRVSLLLTTLARSPFARYPLTALVADAWALRANLSLRDALYVALARRLGATLITADQRLARAPELGIALLVV